MWLVAANSLYGLEMRMPSGHMRRGGKLHVTQNSALVENSVWKASPCMHATVSPPLHTMPRRSHARVTGLKEDTKHIAAFHAWTLRCAQTDSFLPLLLVNIRCEICTAWILFIRVVEEDRETDFPSPELT